MTSFAQQMKAQAEALEALFRGMANTCAGDAETGVFHPLGRRCGFCLHAIPGGCRLRLIAAQAAE